MKLAYIDGLLNNIGDTTMNNAILEKEYKGYTVKIFVDDNPINPVEDFDMFGKMICFHNRYNLGHSHDFTTESFQEFLQENKNNIVSLPLYFYDHSGITMRITPFSCQWDSGQVGVIYVTKENIKKEFNVKNITKGIMEKVLNLLKAEVETYNKYLTGQIYGYQILKGEDVEDSCWGYYDEPENILKDCIADIEKYYVIQLELAI